MKINYIESLDGYLIPQLMYENKTVHLTSLYNTRKQIDMLLENFKKVDLSKPTIIFGISNCEYIDDIKKYIHDGNIFIVEPIKELREKAKETLGNKVEIFSLEDVDTVNFRNVVKKIDINIIAYAAYKFIFKKDIEKCVDRVTERVIEKISDIQTQKGAKNLWVENYFSNLLHSIKDKSLEDLRDKHANKPAIIVSAGPSLDKTLDYLTGNDDRFIIISGGRTLPSLIKKNIHCDYTCIIDGNKGTYDVMEEALHYKDSCLIYCGATEKRVVELFEGEKRYFITSQTKVLDELIFSRKVTSLWSSSSVAISCLDLAMLLGCNPIIMIGQDLAYTDNKHHANIAKLSSEKEDVENYANKILIENVFGESVETSYEFKSVLKDFEFCIDLISKNYPDIKFINCSKGGANILGAPYKDFKDVLNLFDNKIESKISVDEIRNIDAEDIMKSILNMKNLIVKLEKGIRLLDKYINVLNDSIDSNYLNIFEIKKLNKRIRNTLSENLIKYYISEESRFLNIDYDKNNLEESKNEILELISDFGILKSKVEVCIGDLEEDFK